MKLIHSDERFRDVSIWYDDNLNPGEEYSDAIMDALHSSSVFVMLITPNMLEESNYVIKHEYPEAMKLGLPILPIMLVPTDEKR